MEYSVVALRPVQCLKASRPMVITLQSVTEDSPARQQGDYWIGGFEDRHTPDNKPKEIQGDRPTGTLNSPFFEITGRYITFLIGGGCDANLIHTDLIIDREVRNYSGRAF